MVRHVGEIKSRMRFEVHDESTSRFPRDDDDDGGDDDDDDDDGGKDHQSND